MRSKSFQYGIAIFWLCLVTVLLVIPGSRFPKENWLDKLWFDKWVHIGLFSVMVFLWCRITAKSSFFFLIAFLFLLYGTGMEFVQKYFVANRGFEFLDIVADGIGCIAGLVFSLKYRKR